MRERPADPTAEAGLPSSAAERDPAVGRRPRVVEREPRVGDALAASPADLREAIGNRFGQDHVTRPGDEPATELGHRGSPGVEGDNYLAGDDQARSFGRRGGDDGRRRAAALEADDARSLVDDDAAFQGDTSKAAGERGRLDGRGAGHERALAEHGGADLRSDLLAGQRPPAIRESEPRARFDRLAPRAILGGRGTDREEPGRRPPGVDAVCRRPRPDLFDRGVNRVRGPQRLYIAEPFNERRQLVPPAGDEAAVPTRRATAADVLLDNDDPRPRREFGEAKRGPQPRVTAAEDREVGRGVGGERWRDHVRAEFRRLGLERRAEPERAPGARADAVERVRRIGPRHQPPASRTSRWRTRAATVRR